MAKNQEQVTIVSDELNNKIRISKNKAEFAHVLLRQEKTIIGTNGWVKTNTLHTLLHGKVEALKDLGIAKMKYLPGQIVVKEQLTPFSETNPDADYKRAGKTGPICCKHGEPIYRKAFYDATMLESDELIPHTNGDDIRKSNNTKADEILSKYPTKNKQIDLEDSIAEVEEEKSMISHETLTETIAEEITPEVIVDQFPVNEEELTIDDEVEVVEDEVVEEEVVEFNL